MGTTLVAGQNAKLSNTHLTFKLNVINAPSANLDASAILLATNGKVSSDDDFIFFNQPQHTSGALIQKDGSTFSVDLSKVPPHLEKIVFVLTVEQSLSALASGYHFRIFGDSDDFEFTGQGSGRSEKSLIVSEIYRRNGDWKVKVVDQGFTGGMAPLAEHFGVEVDASAGQGARTPSPPPKPVEKRPISLSKITLEKKGDTVSLEKKSNSFGKIHVNLNWNQGSGAVKKGLLGSLMSGNKGGIDLDLGCMYEFRDGSKGIVQALGNNFGSLDSAPYMFLDGDDRTGAVNTGESLYINGKHWNDIKRVMIFAFIYEGVPNWAQTDGRVVISTPEQPEIEIRMDATGSDQNFCVIAMLENRNGSLNIAKEVNYFAGHQVADEQYGFGFKWKVGRK
ncbi:TerD family protein [Halomonas sp. 11-S5]|uniref:TerD family protein n=1 Tax=Halomonas sp. 11-S5 TaxID=2994064 RepID=UPI0024694CFB|nr:TerD family protein [Halomonas sp. 11-S5]